MRQSKTPSKLTLAHALMVVAGLVTFVLVSAVLRDRSETATVLVATVSAPAGSEASALGLTPLEVPASHALSEQFVASGTVSGTERIARDVVSGQPLLKNDLLAPEQRVATRTFAIAVDDLVLRGLGLRVADRVDLIGQDDEGNVYYVVTDVAVASRSQIATDSGFAASSGSFLTVEVTDAEALAISAALRSSPVDVVRSTGAQAIDLAAPQDTAMADLEAGE